MQTLVHKDQEVIDAIIRKSEICFIGVCDENNMPYVIPMNFGFENNVIYLHSAQTGKMIDAIKHNNNICVTFSIDHELVFQHPDVACSYRMKSKSVMAFGKVEFIDDDDLDQKRDILNIMMRQYSDKEFKYNDPAVRNVKIWKVPIESMSCKEFGAPHDQYKIQRGLEALKAFEKKKKSEN